MSLANFGVRKPVVANLVMFALLGAGIVFGTNLRREFFPEIRPSMVTITAPYPGASPEEVEQSLAVRIEDKIADLRDIKEVESTVSEGLATILVEYEEGVRIEDAVAEIKREVDALEDLPEESDNIVVDKLEPNLPVIVLSLFGDADARDLKTTIRMMRDDLKTLEGMSDIAIDGARTDEIRVEVDPAKMLEYRLSLPAISGLVREHMRELPGGTVRTTTSNTAIRTVASEERAASVGKIVVASAPGGRVVRLSDVASVEDTFSDIDLTARLNGKPTVSLTIFKVGEQDAIDMADMVKAYAAGLKGEPFELRPAERLAGSFQRPGTDEPASERVRAYELGVRRAALTPLPADVALTTDLARFIKGRLDLLTRNALWGLMLVFATLFLLLNWRTSFWVGVGLVVAIAGTLAAMRFLGVTLNLLTMFGLIVVLGLLVDDAIVVAENITRRHERGEKPTDAAIGGTNQVLWPVVAAVLTTVFAFLPLALIEGQLGDMLQWLPIVVAIALGASLIESLLILPSHVGHSLEGADKRKRAGHVGLIERFESRFDGGRDRVINRVLIPAYVHLLGRAIRARYLTLVIFIAILIVSAAMVAGGRLQFIFFETDDAEVVNANIRMAVGTPVERTDEVVRMIERAALAQPEVPVVWAVAGAQGDLNGELPDTSQSHLGQVVLELIAVEDRPEPKRTSKQVIDSILAEVGSPAGVKSLRMEGMGAGPAGPPITVGITAENHAIATTVAGRVKQLLESYQGVYGIYDDADQGQRELRIELRDGASELGFTVTDLAQQIRAAVVGLEAYTFAGDRENVDIRVTLPRDMRRNLAAIEQMHVFTPAGDPVPLGEVARLSEQRANATIRRLDRDRIVTVAADVTEETNPDQVFADLRPQLTALEREYPGVRIIQRGRQKDMAESFASLPIGMAAAAGLIYIVLCWLFASYAQPLIVMSAIPFATIGMIWGHVLMGYQLTFLSLIGFVALSGVVVNDSLILMQFYNDQRADGIPMVEALLRAGRNRFRAIVLTTITTVLGLSPLMLEQSFQAKFLIPMAITISFGLISATAIILIVLPCLLVIFDDIRRGSRYLWTGVAPEPRVHAAPEAVLPAGNGMNAEARS